MDRELKCSNDGGDGGGGSGICSSSVVYFSHTSVI